MVAEYLDTGILNKANQRNPFAFAADDWRKSRSETAHGSNRWLLQQVQTLGSNVETGSSVDCSVSRTTGLPGALFSICL
jgi:hypothetical protein